MPPSDETDRILWLDFETTGLVEPIIPLELGAIVTDGQLQPLAGMHVIFDVNLDTIQMGRWAWQTHTANGLLDEIQRRQERRRNVIRMEGDFPPFGHLRGFADEGPMAIGMLDRLLSQFVRQWCPGAPLAGNSIGYDKGILQAIGCTATLDALHYRVIDISSFREMMRRWAPGISMPPKGDKHRVFDDLALSIESAHVVRERLATELVSVPLSDDPRVMADEWLHADPRGDAPVHVFMGWTKDEFKHWEHTGEVPEDPSDPFTGDVYMDRDTGDASLVTVSMRNAIEDLLERMKSNGITVDEALRDLRLGEKGLDEVLVPWEMEIAGRLESEHDLLVEEPDPDAKDTAVLPIDDTIGPLPSNPKPDDDDDNIPF